MFGIIPVLFTGDKDHTGGDPQFRLNFHVVCRLLYELILCESPSKTEKFDKDSDSEKYHNRQLNCCYYEVGGLFIATLYCASRHPGPPLTRITGLF